MAEQNQALTMHCDAGPLRLFTELFYRAVKVRERFFEVGDLPQELARVEGDDAAAGACELTMTLYPSDGFMRFAAAVLARDVDPGVVEDADHRNLVAWVAGQGTTFLIDGPDVEVIRDDQPLARVPLVDILAFARQHPLTAADGGAAGGR
jgi:hypothetical protein